MSEYIAVLVDIMEVSKLSPEFMPYVDIKANLQPTKHGACQLKLPQNTAIQLVMLPSTPFVMELISGRIGCRCHCKGNLTGK